MNKISNLDLNDVEYYDLKEGAANAEGVPSTLFNLNGELKLAIGEVGINAAGQVTRGLFLDAEAFIRFLSPFLDKYACEEVPAIQEIIEIVDKHSGETVSNVQFDWRIVPDGEPSPIGIVEAALEGEPLESVPTACGS